jgi:lysophospholipid acyltransferase (LPLAT)-like uncharacterized protein
VTERIARLAELIRLAGPAAHPSAMAAGRNRFTRAVDRMLLCVRRYAPPVHWLVAVLFGAGLFAYVWLVARTSRVVPVGARMWPNLPAACVMAIWHDNAPALLAALAKSKPRPRLVVLVSTEPRGDALSVLFRLLGVRVIRGDWEHHGWPAITRTAELVAGGACAIITPDGGGPRRIARPGVLVLAAAAGVPLVVLGADCTPAWTEPHKWDRPRNPLPFGRIVVCVNSPVRLDDLKDAEAVESARIALQQNLNEAYQAARLELQR